MGFGETVFSGSRFIFWCLAPVLVLCRVGLPFLLSDWSAERIAFCVAWSSGCLLMVLALYDIRRFWWAARIVTAIIFIVYSIYFIDQIFLSGNSLPDTFCEVRNNGRRGRVSSSAPRSASGASDMPQRMSKGWFICSAWLVPRLA